MSTQDLVAEIENLVAELRKKTLALLLEMEELGESDMKTKRLLADIFLNGDKIIRVADVLAVKCRKYLEKTRR